MSIVYGPYGSLNGDYYARGLGHVLRSYRLYDPDFALTRDPEVYEKLRRDPVISFALRFRKLLARGADWFIEPASPDPADRQLSKAFEDLLKHVEYFDAARYNLAESIATGSRWARIEGELRTCKIGGQPPMEWWVCTDLVDVDKRRFRQFPLDAPAGTQAVAYPGADGAVTEVELPTVNREWIWQIYRPLQQRWEEIERDDYVRHVHENREEDLHYGAGLASELYTYWYSKEIVLQQGLQYLERWAQGMLLAAVETLRDGQASSPPSAKRMEDWLTALTNMRSRHVVVYDGRDKVDVKDAPPTGWKAAMEALEYLDGVMRVAILGASLPTTHKIEGGSYALAEVQERTTETLVRYDHAVLEDSIRRDLLGWLYRKNKPNFDRVGLGQATIPYFRLRSTHADNHAEWADILIKVRQAGLDVRRDEAYARVGLSIPSPGDEILAPLGMQESLNQGGDPLTGEGLGPQARPGGVGDNSDAARDVADRVADAGRNRIRPPNAVGTKPDREHVIDKQTEGFAA